MVVDKWLRRVHASSIWEGGNQDNFKPIYFVFYKKIPHAQKAQKAPNANKRLLFF